MATADRTLAPAEVDPGPPPGSLLAAARARRRLSVEEAAARAGLDPETVRSLEQARVYRFETTQDALSAALVYAASLGISRREARTLVGLPVRPKLLDGLLSLRLWAAVVFLGALAAGAWLAIDRTRLTDPGSVTVTVTAPAVTVTPEEALPAPWQIEVTIYNGSARPNAATILSNAVAALGYTIGEVTDAPRRDYPDTRVYFPPGGEAIAERLAAEIGVGTAALPGGDNPRRLVIVVGARD